MNPFELYKKFMCLDVETSGLDWTTDKLHGVSVGYSETDIKYYPVWDIPQHVKDDLANPAIPKLGQNFHGFDAKFLQKYVGPVAGMFDDVMVVWNLIDPDSSVRLKYLSDKHLGYDSLEAKRELDQYMAQYDCRHVGELCAKDLLNDSHPHLETIAKYCIEDNINTQRLFFLGLKKLQELDQVIKGPKFTGHGFKKSPLDYYFEEARPLEKVLFDIEYRGVRVNVNLIQDIKAACDKTMDGLAEKMTAVMQRRIALVEDNLCAVEQAKVKSEKTKATRVAGHGKCKFSWKNNNHVAQLLYNFCDLPPQMVKRTGKGKYRTDKAAIGELLAADIPDKLKSVLRQFQEYRLQYKIASTYTGTNKKGIVSKIRYINGIPRIFPQYRQTTGTGRLACKNPNMQNLKRDSDVKRFFIPDSEDSVFDSLDYSQIELRDGAHMSKDVGLVESYINNEDVHIRTATRLFKKAVTKSDDTERQAGKRTNFLTLFDGKAPRLQAALKADTGKDFSIQECKEFIKIWFEIYPGVKMYLEQQLDFFKKYKFCISETGRIRRLPDIIFGKDIKWEQRQINGDLKWTPRYRGPQHLRTSLIHSFMKKNKKFNVAHISEEMIGWEAHRRYNHAIKSGYNQPIQGLAASQTKRSMIAMHDLGLKIANQVHDEIVIERPKIDAAAVKLEVSIMENIYPCIVPIVVDVKTLNSFHPNDKAMV